MIVWVVLLLATLPFLSRIGTVTTNSTTTLPSSAPSALAEAKFAALFPSAGGGGSSAVLLVYGPNVTSTLGQQVVQNVTKAIRTNASLTDIASVDSVYTAYAAYLAGQAELAGSAIAAAQGPPSPLTDSINSSASLLWEVPHLYFATWANLVNTSGGGNASLWNYPAYNATRTALANQTVPLAILSVFYNGNGSSGAGFNGTAACASLAPNLTLVRACADAAVRTNVGLYVPYVVPSLGLPVAYATLQDLALENYTAWPNVRAEASSLLASSTGGYYPSAWFDAVWTAFPSGVVAPAPALAFANATVANATLANPPPLLASPPLSVPYGILSQYVNAARTASLVQVSFSVPDDTTSANGSHPVYDDLSVLASLVPASLRASDPSGTFLYAETGPAPLNELTQASINASLQLVLPLTVGLLLAISMIYFRSPIAPLLTFAGLGIALVLGIGATILLGTLVTHVDTTSLTLEEVFVLGVGTDYSIFLVARYREELLRGRTSEEAIVASVSWAGQSVATSGSTAILVTVALALSGVALLSQWGMVLSVAIFITMVLSLTLVPAFLKLVGPRIFWPTTGARFERHSRRHSERVREGRTYFYRAARATATRSRTVVGAILLASVPLVALALTVPVSYDFYGQLPPGHTATVGLAELGAQFGPGFSVPSFALVTFASSLVVGNVSNATEFVDVENLTSTAANTSGIAAVSSPLGPSGATLSEWLSLSSLPPLERANLLGLLGGFVGSDGRTVLFSIVPSATGLSEQAVSAVGSVETSFATFASTHPEVVAVDFGGGAPVIHDLANQTNTATDAMIVAVTIGLVAVLLAVLRSWILAVMAVGTIGLSISWAWALTDLVFQRLFGWPVFFYVRTILFLLVLGLGIDYNIFLLTRVREERLRGRSSGEAAIEAVGRTGGIITAAAVILASAFAALLVADFTLIRAIGFSVAVAVVLDAMVVRTYLVPASLQILGDRVWSLRRRPPPAPVESDGTPVGTRPAPGGSAADGPG